MKKMGFTFFWSARAESTHTHPPTPPFGANSLFGTEKQNTTKTTKVLFNFGFRKTKKNQFAQICLIGCEIVRFSGYPWIFRSFFGRLEDEIPCGCKQAFEVNILPGIVCVQVRRRLFT